MSFLNRLVPFYFCISFYVTGPSIRTLVSMACLYIVSIKLASAGGGSSFSVSVSPQCCLEVLSPYQPPEQFLVKHQVLHGAWGLQPSPATAHEIEWDLTSALPHHSSSLQKKPAGASSRLSEDGAIVATLYITKVNLDVFPDSSSYLRPLNYLLSMS